MCPPMAGSRSSTRTGHARVPEALREPPRGSEWAYEQLSRKDDKAHFERHVETNGGATRGIPRPGRSSGWAYERRPGSVARSLQPLGRWHARRRRRWSARRRSPAVGRSHAPALVFRRQPPPHATGVAAYFAAALHPATSDVAVGDEHDQARHRLPGAGPRRPLARSCHVGRARTRPIRRPTTRRLDPRALRRLGSVVRCRTHDRYRRPARGRRRRGGADRDARLRRRDLDSRVVVDRLIGPERSRPWSSDSPLSRASER